MQSIKRLALVFALSTISLHALSESVIAVDQPTLNQHLDHKVAPVYPAIANAARVQGTVVLEVRIGTTGKIESTKVVSGPAMLQSAAIDCVKQWTYRPFEKDGSPVSASGRVSIEFSLGIDSASAKKDEEIAQRYFPLSDQCRKSVSARSDTAAAADACRRAAETADEFGPDVRYIEKRSAFVWAAYGLMGNGDLKAALAYGNKAVDEVKLGHDDNSGSNAAYGVRGMVEARMGDLSAADQDLNVAEDFERKGIAWAEEVKFEHGDSYKHALAQDLHIHAQVLQALNKPDEAKLKLAEAAKYE